MARWDEWSLEVFRRWRAGLAAGRVPASQMVRWRRRLAAGEFPVSVAREQMACDVDDALAALLDGGRAGVPGTPAGLEQLPAAAGYPGGVSPRGPTAGPWRAPGGQQLAGRLAAVLVVVLAIGPGRS